MLKKLTEEQQTAILECAIEQFGDLGLERTTVSAIAGKAGVSVGVIYKYYRNKEDLFHACLDRSVTFLGEVLDRSVKGEKTLPDQMRALIRACRTFALEHPSYLKMYHEITTRSDRDHAADYARRIESMTADVYSRLFSKAKAQGEIRGGADPRADAFFFDNLLMMMHFSYGCDYYRERMKIYTGIRADDEKEEDGLAEEMVQFLLAAIGYKEQ